MRVILPVFAGLLSAGCSVFGQTNFETAPYTLLKADSSQNIEVFNLTGYVLVRVKLFCQPGC
ncbi:hypothetical protein [Rheinheimera gaetbuli]